MPFRFSEGSLKKFKGVHPDLVKVMNRAITISTVDFKITEGLRSQQRQLQLVAAGASRTMKSRHLTGHAVDVAALVGKDVRWDWPLYTEIAKAVKEAAKQEQVPIEWGGDWETFKDGPHFQLPWAIYP
jgi:peptidoglycan L-alanyl-D-glutamate endopeptidase CwlK